MVVTSPFPGSTSSGVTSSWETQSQIRASESSASTVSGGNALGSSSTSLNYQSSSDRSTWRMKRFAARVGFLAGLAVIGIPGVVAGATPTNQKTFVQKHSIQYGLLSNTTVKSRTDGQSDLSPIDEFPSQGLAIQDLPTPGVMPFFSPPIEIRNPATEDLPQHGMNIAGRDNADAPSKDTMKMTVYPDNLMQEYKSLMRDQRLGQMSVLKKKRLEEVRQGIQKISRSDEKSQQAAREVRLVTHSLVELEKQVDTRIAQRKNEKLKK